MVTGGKGYRLLDPREIAARAPYTFYRPSDTELAGVGAGDLVQLMFEHVPPGESWGVERMWVSVTLAHGDRLGGTLDNTPDEPSASLRHGDPVSFARHHIIGVRWADPAGAPEPAAQRMYWERCLVDACVLDGSEPVEFLYRETPDMGEPDDRDPDSGWRIRGRQGEAGDAEMDARKLQYVALGAVLNRDDSWLHLIDAPVGARFMRDFGTDAYVAVED